MSAYYCIVRDNIGKRVCDAARSMVPGDWARIEGAPGARIGAPGARGIWPASGDGVRGLSFASIMVSTVVFVAHYYARAKGVFAGLLEAASASLPDGSPSGATVVDAEDLTFEVAFEWWHPSVVLERLSQVLHLSLGSRPWPGSQLSQAGEAAGHRGLPPRLSALLDRAARRVKGNRSGSSADSPGLVFVFSHGGGGIVLSADRLGSALEKKDRLQVRRGSASGRRPSVLAAYIEDACVTEAIGRLAVLPPPETSFGTIAPGRALAAYLASQGFDRLALERAKSATVAPRGGGPPVDYALSRP